MPREVRSGTSDRRREIVVIAVVLFGFAVLFQLLGQIQFFRSAEQFAYPVDGALWLFGDALLSLAVVTLVLRMLRRGEQLPGYLRVLLVGLAVYAPIGVLQHLAIERLLFDKTHTGYTILRYAAMHVTQHLIVANGYLAYRYLSELGRTRRQLLEAERDRAEMELRQLQRAVSPHFLFNSLNILHGLIGREPAAAAEFTLRLARLYRYIVRHADDELVSLGEELEFARDYAFLLGVRFGRAWVFDIAAPPTEPHSYVVPTAVQGLIENAVKHNVAQEHRPLCLRIGITGEALVVWNETEPRATREPPGRGLALLRARYERLTDGPVRIDSTPTAFTVTLPLLRAL